MTRTSISMARGDARLPRVTGDDTLRVPVADAEAQLRDRVRGVGYPVRFRSTTGSPYTERAQYLHLG